MSSKILKIMLIRFLFFFLIFYGVVNDVFAQTFSPEANYEVCFTPESNCTDLLVTAIERAKKSVYVQAFSFTSRPIAYALVKAKRSGITVEIIVDKSQVETEKYSEVKYLSKQNIPIYVDANVAVAHNKVMIIDEDQVFTGSFNFTKAAQEKNAENLLMLADKKVAQLYMDNWLSRKKVSTPFNNYHPDVNQHFVGNGLD